MDKKPEAAAGGRVDAGKLTSTGLIFADTRILIAPHPESRTYVHTSLVPVRVRKNSPFSSISRSKILAVSSRSRSKI